MEPTHDPAIAELLSFFDFAHLRERTPHLAAASEPFHRLAHIMAPDPSAAVDGLRATILRMDCEPGREAAAAALKLRRLEAALVAPDYAVIDSAGPEDFLRTLLEAKDCAVRAALVRHRAEQADGLTSSKSVAVSDLPGLLAGLEAIEVRHNARGPSLDPEGWGPPVDAAGNITMEAGPGATMPDDEPHAVVDLGAVARAAIADGDKGVAALGEAAASLGVIGTDSRWAMVESLTDGGTAVPSFPLHVREPLATAVRGVIREQGAVYFRVEITAMDPRHMPVLDGPEG